MSSTGGAMVSMWFKAPRALITDLDEKAHQPDLAAERSGYVDLSVIYTPEEAGLADSSQEVDINPDDSATMSGHLAQAGSDYGEPARLVPEGELSQWKALVSRRPAYVTLALALDATDFINFSATDLYAPGETCRKMLLAWSGSGSLIRLRSNDGTPTSACDRIGRFILSS
jgi:hypothetical protein